ncbi:MAG TPA: DUF255 domain-containing protein [Terriglobales bacterium]|nr:DUF255 domain-containing protein [Terriglobales bacterium]
MSAKSNRLAAETGPYLLQHAHNPVDWYPWGPEAVGGAIGATSGAAAGAGAEAVDEKS